MRIASHLAGVLAVIYCCATQAAPITISPLLPILAPTTDLRLESGSTYFIFFQSERQQQLDALAVFGEPLDFRPELSEFRFQLFRTTAAWEAPGGNADRLWLDSYFFPDLGRNLYVRAVSDVVLDAGGYYRLSFQVSNVDWLLPLATRIQGGTFITIGGAFEVFGSCFSSTSPCNGREFPAFVTATTKVPEPGTVALLGLGLAGIGLALRKRAA